LCRKIFRCKFFDHFHRILHWEKFTLTFTNSI
jgi:hypothetical protein